MFFNPPPSPPDADFVAPVNLRKTGIPLVNFCMSAANAPDVLLMTVVTFVNADAVPLIIFFKPPQPF